MHPCLGATLGQSRPGCELPTSLTCGAPVCAGSVIVPVPQSIPPVQDALVAILREAVSLHQCNVPFLVTGISSFASWYPAMHTSFCLMR